jgi:prepilin signal peptidase PulO-like enzyme (type II secretory pathway)
MGEVTQPELMGVIIAVEILLGGMKLAWAVEYLGPAAGEGGAGLTWLGLWRRGRLYICFLAAGAGLAVLYAAQPGAMVVWQYADLVFSYLLLAVVDLRRKIVPNNILLCLIGGQLFYATQTTPWPALWRNCLIGAAVFALAAALALVWRGKFGMGDAKLIGVTVAFAGWQYTLQVVFWALTAAALTGVILLVGRRVHMKTELPFVPFLALAVLWQLALTLRVN